MAAAVNASQAAMRIVPPIGAAIANRRWPAKARSVMSPENKAPPSTHPTSPTSASGHHSCPCRTSAAPPSTAAAWNSNMQAALSSPRPGAVRDNRHDHEVHEGRRQTGWRTANAGSRLKLCPFLCPAPSSAGAESGDLVGQDLTGKAANYKDSRAGEVAEWVEA